jgi:hypothetical protein
VKKILADPAVNLKRTKDTFGEMPNLNLKTDEIDALTAFLIAKSGT